MKKSLINISQISILLLILYLIFNEFDTEKITFIVYSYSYIGIFYIVAITIFSYIMHAYRWTYLSNNQCTLLASFEATSIATVLNFILPAKLGEVSKIVYLKKIYNFNLNNGISLIMIEKFFDLILLAMVSVLAVELILENNYVNMVGYVFIVFSIISISLIKTKIILKATRLIPIKFLRVYSKKILSNIYKNFTYTNLFNIFILTIFIWILFYATEYMAFNYVADFKLSAYQILTVFVVSTIALSLPLTPGSIGVYEGSMVMSLGWYGIDKESALMASLVLRLTHILAIFLIAFIILLTKNITISDFKKNLT